MKFFFPFIIFYYESLLYEIEKPELVFDENASLSFMDLQSFFDLAILSIIGQMFSRVLFYE